MLGSIVSLFEALMLVEIDRMLVQLATLECVRLRDLSLQPDLQRGLMGGMSTFLYKSD